MSAQNNDSKNKKKRKMSEKAARVSSAEQRLFCINSLNSGIACLCSQRFKMSVMKYLIFSCFLNSKNTS